MKSVSTFAASLALATAVSAMPLQQRSEDVWGSLRGKIKHVVYLMLENHSFDNIAGYWDFNPDIDNLRNIDFCNNYTNSNWTIYGEPLLICAAPYESEVPFTDPDHNFGGTNYQLYQNWNPTNNDTATMGGFIERQSDKYSAPPGETAFVIQAYDAKKSHTLAYLAENFAFFDSYHAEHPGPTNPNRQFATSGSACGMVDNTYQDAEIYSTYAPANCSLSIFEALDQKNISWKNYYETVITDAFMYEYVQNNAKDKLAHASAFYEDIANGTLPAFSYYNPECCSVDSMHPTSSMAGAEQLVKHLYDAVRNSQYWDETLIIINFDEHGGFADHVPPPVDIPAPEDGITFDGVSDGHNVTYDYTRLGVRVPAFLISPWIPANLLIHDQGTMYESNSAYTHTSMLHFLQNLWDLPTLNNRVQWAKTFEFAFSDTKRDDTPTNLPIPRWYGGSTGDQPDPYYLLNQDLEYYESLE
ncbi:phospholipase, PLC-D [Xylariales sp. PMI_506]|nr:phospholipase, PLC-D [Xylariales sp. PMI_506]